MELHYKYWADEGFREKLLNKMDTRRVPKFERIMSKKWDLLTDQDKRDIAAAMPKANWMKELCLENLMENLEDSLPRHMKDHEGRMIVGEEEAALARGALGEVIYSRLLNKPFASWTVLDMAELQEVIGDLYAEGREIERARLEARLKLRDQHRDRIIKLIKTAGIKEGATPEEIEKKLYKFRPDEYGNVKKNSIFNSFYDANVRRFTTALGGGGL
jgi:hypothetical protein